MTGYTIYPQNNLQKQVAAYTRRAFDETAPATLQVTCDVTRLREALTLPEHRGLRLGPVVIHAALQTLRVFPRLNAHLTPEGLCQYTHVKLGVMVNTGGGVLIVCLPEAETLDQAGLQDALTNLQKRACARGIAFDEMRGSTFNVVDLSEYAVDVFTPIPMHGALGFLGIGRTRSVCQPTEAGCRQGWELTLNLTIDHRGTDAIYAGRFLSALVDRLESYD